MNPMDSTASHDLLRVINEAPIGRDWDEHSAQALIDALAAEGFQIVQASEQFERIQTLRAALFGLLTAGRSERDSASGRAMAVLDESLGW